MNIPQSITLSETEVLDLLTTAQKQELVLTYVSEKHQLILEKGQDWMAKIYLPWTYGWDEKQGFFLNEDAHFSLVLIRAGQASIGYFHQGKLLDHKVFRAYMVRQKQGKSQIKHLKTKGKSRAGSRIRLAETEHFFEEINQRLQAYSSAYSIDFWGISCGKTLWPFLFESAVFPPFSSKQSNLIELPFHISQASFEELENAGKLLGQFHLILSEKGKEYIKASKKHEKETDSEDW